MDGAWRTGIFIVLVAIPLLIQVQGRSLSDFIQFGANFGDSILPSSNDASVGVQLQQPIPFLGQTREYLTLFTDGVVDLRESSSSLSRASIYAFSADVDTSAVGHVLYREVGMLDSGLLNTTGDLIRQLFPCFGDFTPTSIFVATWFYVGYFDNHNDLSNTFQCLVMTDTNVTFVALLYADDMIEWTTGDADGGVGGQGGDPADVGFVDDSFLAFFLPGSNTSDVLTLDSRSNVGMPGLWVFRVDGVNITVPDLNQCVLGLDNCDINAQCTPVKSDPGFRCDCNDGFVGDGVNCSELVSGSGSGSGSGSAQLPEGSCVAAGFTSCCTGANCATGSGSNVCQCDQNCFFFSDCCTDITEVPCFPVISVGFSMPTFTVREPDGVVELGVVATGNFPSPDLQSQLTVPVEAVVIVYTVDVDAEAAIDYQGTIRVLTFINESTQSVPVSIFDDQLLEGDEFFLGLLSSSDDFVQRSLIPTTIRIEDDDDATISLQQTMQSVAEGDGNLEVCVDIAGATLARSLTVTLTPQPGTASIGDFDGSSLPVTFLPGNTTVCGMIGIVNDAIVEDTESFTVVLNSSDPQVTVNATDAEATIMISDDDQVVVGLTQLTYDVDEGDTVMVCAQLQSGQLERSVTVTFSTSSDPAIAGDFAAVFGEQRTIEPSAPDQPVCVNISTVEDNVVESTELFTVFLNTSDPGVMVNSTAADAPVSIIDDDFVQIDFQLDAYSTMESSGAVEVCVELTGSIERNVSATLFTTDMDAAAPSDYTSTTRVIMFYPGSSSTVCVNIMVFLDGVIENEREFFRANLSTDDPAVMLPRASVPVTIIDSDMVNIGLTQAGYTASEAMGSVSVCVEIDSAQLARNVSVTLSSVNSGSAVVGIDYLPDTIEIQFQSAPGTMCRSFTLLEDAEKEQTETFVVQLQESDPAVTLTNTIATVSIVDSTVIRVGFDPVMYVVNESEGVVTVSVSAMDTLTGGTLSVTLETEDGTASGGIDFAPSFEVLTFNSATSRIDVNITILNVVAAVEQQETFGVRLTAFDPCINLTEDVATVTINDDTVVNVEFVQSAVTVRETDGSASVCVTISGAALDRNVTVYVLIDDGTAMSPGDYTAVSPQHLTFTSAPSQMCITVSISSDGVVEPTESFTVTLNSSDPAVQLLQASASVTIIDTTEVQVEFAQPSFIAREDDGSISVCVNISGASLDRNVSIYVSIDDGTALSPGDYTAVSPQHLTFTSAPSQMCITVSVSSDGVVEPTESFTVTLNSSDPAVQLPQASASVTIIDTTLVQVEFAQAAFQVREDQGQVSVCIDIRGAVLNRDVTVLLSTQSSTAVSPDDYTSISSQPVTFSSAPSQMCVSVSISDDNLVETTELFSVALDSTDPAVQITLQSAGVTIIDSTIVQVRFAQAAFQVREDQGPVSVCIDIRGAELERDVTVLLSTIDGTAISPGDYTAISSQPVTFSSAPDQMCVPINITSDVLIEGTELFTVTLFSGDPAVEVTVQNASVIITEFDPPVVQLVPPFVASEADGFVSVCINISGSVLGRNITVLLSTQDDTAISPDDYTNITSQPVTFSSAPFQICVPIMISSDGLLEDTESFTVTLVTEDPAVIITLPSADVTVIDANEVQVAFTQSVFPTSEAIGSVSVSVAISGAVLDRTVTVLLSTQDFTAISPGDYTAISSQPVTFSSSPSQVFIPITISTDIVVEETEIFTVELESTDSAVQLTLQSANVTISDSTDVQVEFAQGAFSVREDQGPVSVCIDIRGAVLDRDVTMLLSTQDGTAMSPGDYTAIMSQPVTFSSSPSQMCVSVPISNDNFVETTELFGVALDSTDRAVQITLPAAGVTIIDSTTVQVGFSQASFTTSESVGSVSVCIDISGAVLARSVTVLLSTADGTAMSPGDYTAIISQPVTFSSSPTQMCFSVTIISDNVVEGTESFTVRLDSTDPAVEITLQNASVTIIEAPVVQFAQASFAVNEAAGSVPVCVNIFGTLIGSVTVLFSTQDNTAISPGDYTAIISQPVTFSSSPSQMCVSVTISNDNLVEATEELFGVALDPTDPAAVQITLPSAGVTITDSTTVQVGFSQPSFTASEAEGSVLVCINTFGSVGFARSVTVLFSTLDDVAVSPGDYTSISFQTVAFSNAPDEMCVSVSIVSDNVVEGPESFDVRLDSTDPAVQIILQFASVTIVEAPTVQFAQASFAVNEAAGSVPVCVNIFGTLIGSVTVLFSTQDNTAVSPGDYTAIISQPVTFSSSPSQMCVSVTISNDNLVEATEELFGVALDSTDPAAVQITLPSASVTITDSTTVQVGFSQSSFTASESQGSVLVCINTFGSVGFARSVTVLFSTLDDVAASPDDYTSISFQTVAFSNAPDQMCVSVSIVNDNVVEGPESFDVRLDSTDPAVQITLQFASVTIVEAPVVQFAQASFAVNEAAGSVPVCVNIFGTLIGSVTVLFSTQDNTAVSPGDYTAIISQPVTFSSSPSQMCVSVTISNDNLVEATEELFGVALDPTDPAAVQITLPSASVTITDSTTVQVGFSQSSFTASESQGSVLVCINTFGSVGFARSVTVLFSTLDDVAASPDDYTSISFQTVAFSNAPDQMCVSVSIVNDNVVEGPESFDVRLDSTDPAVQITLQFASVTIVEAPVVQFAQASFAVNEAAGSVPVCVNIFGTLIGSVTVLFSTQDNTAVSPGDYTAIISQPVTFSSSPSQMCVSVTISNDNLVEATELFGVALDPTDPAAVQITLPSASVTITDSTTVQVGFSQTSFTASESLGSVSVCIDISGAVLARSVTVLLSTADGTAMSPGDFTAISFQPVTFSSAPSQMCVSVTISDDNVVEGDELFTVLLGSNDLAVQFTQQSASVIIIDDILQVTLSNAMYIFNENADDAIICVEYVGTVLDRIIDISFSLVEDGTATAGLDYEVTPTVNIQYNPAMAQELISVCERINIIDDTIPEGMETLSVRLDTDDPAVSFVIQTAPIAITDNDNTNVLVGFISTEFTAQEEDSLSSAIVGVVVQGLISSTFTVRVSTSDGTAVAGLDYQVTTQDLQFSPGNNQPQYVFVTILLDTLIEDTETINLQLSAIPGQASVFTIQPDMSSATILIEDNDALPPPDSAIVIINDTPEVTITSSTTASVRVDFTQSPDVTAVTCSLSPELVPAINCFGGTVTFSGLDASFGRVIFLNILATNAGGVVLANITRQVRLGDNDDCAVTFINSAENAAIVFQEIVFIEWVEIGPVEFTECRINDGDFVRCTSPFQTSDLPPGSYNLRVRPSGVNCRRRIRRNVMFTVAN